MVSGLQLTRQRGLVRKIIGCDGPLLIIVPIRDYITFPESSTSTIKALVIVRVIISVETLFVSNEKLF